MEKRHAGTSVALVSPKASTGLLSGYEVRNTIYKTTKNSTIDGYRKTLETSVFNSLFKFATIRNPWDMMISHYFSPHRGITEWDRERFVKMTSKIRPLRYYVGENTVVRRLLYRLGKCPAPTGVPLDHQLDFLIRFEQLDHDFQQVCARLNIPYHPLPQRNKSDRKHYSAYFDSELIELVRERFSEEIAYGKYSFERK
jgi:hypothetical protein